VSRDGSAARLLSALEQRDDVALASVLHPGVRLVIDSGDATGGRFRGRARVARALRDRLTRQADASLEAVDVNGVPGLALRSRGGLVLGVLSIGVPGAAEPGRVAGGNADGPGARIDELWLSTAPAKLAHWNR
jgi:hypothetical protein